MRGRGEGEQRGPIRNNKDGQGVSEKGEPVPPLTLPSFYLDINFRLASCYIVVCVYGRVLEYQRERHSCIYFRGGARGGELDKSNI